MGLKSFVNRTARKTKNLGSDIAGGAKDLGQDIYEGGKDVVRDVPLVGKALGLESSEELAAKAQQRAAQNALEYQQQMYQEAKGNLSPYMLNSAQNLSALQSGIDSGQYLPKEYSYNSLPPQFSYNSNAPQYNYQGSQLGQLAYSGQPVSTINYSGQPTQFNYSGQPESASIQSYMGNMEENPAYKWQMEQSQKAIDRAAAAGGRWGGGGTAQEMMRTMSGLAAQSYGDMWNRAAQERSAQQIAEQERYSREFKGADWQRQNEQQMYGRALTGTELARQAEQERYGRSLTGMQLQNAAEQSAYDRYGAGYNRNLAAEQLRYDRTLADYQRQLATEQTLRDRSLQNYQMEAERAQNALNQRVGITDIGRQTSIALANAATGQGSQLANLAIQQGNAAANQRLASGNQLQKAIDMGKGVVDIYGSVSGKGKGK